MMEKLKDFAAKNGLPETEVFNLVLGGENGVLPGRLWQGYFTTVGDSAMKCFRAGGDETVEIPYSDFSRAEFGIGNGNLWLQCVVAGKELNFCSPQKSWKSEAGKRLVAKIGEHVNIVDMKLYDEYTKKPVIITALKHLFR